MVLSNTPSKNNTVGQFKDFCINDQCPRGINYLPFGEPQRREKVVENADERELSISSPNKIPIGSKDSLVGDWRGTWINSKTIK